MKNFRIASVVLCTIFSISCKKTVEVTIEPAPRPEFSANLRSIQPGDSVTFVNNSKGDIETYSWSFEGAINSFSDQKNPPPVKYSKPGRYQVSLTVSGPHGSNTITKTDFISVEAVAFNVEWYKTDSISDGYSFYRGKIKGFSNQVLYRGIAFIYDYEDSNPGTTSYGFYIYPNSKGEFLASKSLGRGNFYYRILAYSLDYDVYLSEVKHTSFPEISFSGTSITGLNNGVQVYSMVSNVGSNPTLKLLMSDYPDIPEQSPSDSYMIYHVNGVINTLVTVSSTLKKQNAQLFGRDNVTGGSGYSPVFQVRIPESFESSDYYYANNWSTGNFYRSTTKASSGMYSLASGEYYGSSVGATSSTSVSLTLDTSSTISFKSAQEYLTGSDEVRFYIDNNLAGNLSLTTGFSNFSYPVSAGAHTFRWTLTKYISSNYAGKVFLDDIQITE